MRKILNRSQGPCRSESGCEYGISRIVWIVHAQDSAALMDQASVLPLDVGKESSVLLPCGGKVRIHILDFYEDPNSVIDFRLRESFPVEDALHRFGVGATDVEEQSRKVFNMIPFVFFGMRVRVLIVTGPLPGNQPLLYGAESRSAWTNTVGFLEVLLLGVYPLLGVFFKECSKCWPFEPRVQLKHRESLVSNALPPGHEAQTSLRVYCARFQV